jgi:hypothetical protein
MSKRNTYNSPFFFFSFIAIAQRDARKHLEGEEDGKNAKVAEGVTSQKKNREEKSITFHICTRLRLHRRSSEKKVKRKKRRKWRNLLLLADGKKMLVTLRGIFVE